MAKYVVYKLTQDSAMENLQPSDMPAFVLLAKDIFSVATVESYYEMVRQHHPDSQFVRDIAEVLRQFREWRRQHVNLVKVPD